MESRYNAKKKTCTSKYSVGNNVSVFIPNRYRHASDVKRLPCVIIEKGSGEQPTYKLLTEYGILSKRYTASDVMPFPSNIKCGNPSTKISLSEAAKNAVSSSYTCFLPL